MTDAERGGAYEEGLQAFWDPMRAYWASDTAENREAPGVVRDPAAIEGQYTHGVRDPTRLDPDGWTHDIAQLAEPGNRDIQLDLFHDYGTNVRYIRNFENS